jgi:branched-chain amino acid transport system substrate-binding protein
VLVLNASLLADAPEPITIALNADLSSTNEISGIAIERGARIAIEEINAAGGVLGRELKLVPYDHRRNPARGIHHIEQVATDEHTIAILGGKHTPVILAELESIHTHKIPYLIPWAAGTPLIDHPYHPSYTFRLSLRDADAAGVLVDRARKRGLKKIGLLLEQTAWGRSNEASINSALRQRDLEPAWLEWFVWGQRDFDVALKRLKKAGAEVILFVGNAPEGITLARAQLQQSDPLPVMSHWGIVGGNFEAELGEALERLDWEVIQSFSFFNPPRPQHADRVLARYDRLFGPIKGARDVPSPTGTAHAYDLIHLLARAIKEAGRADRVAVRDALEQLGRYEGLVRIYDPPFTPDRHEALDETDYQMARFCEGAIVPVDTPCD